MRIVITGASGNVGTALLRLLTGDSTHHIVGVTRRKPPAVAPYSGVTWIACDIGGRDAAVHLTDVFLGADVVVHLAWQIQPSHDREQLRRTNQDGTQAVLEAVRRAAVPHLVHMSSIGAYTAAHGQAVDESWPTQGIQTSSYSVDKAACERMLDEYEDGRTITRVRPSVILQEDAASEISRYFIGRLVPIHLMQPALVRLVPFPRDLSAQFVHAQDVAGALARIIAGQAGGAF